MNITALASYILLATLTPGPNTVMALATATKYGFKRAFRFCLGAFLGFAAVIGLCAIFTRMLYRHIPALEPAMRWLGAAYILFLAWKQLFPGGKKGRGGQNATSFWAGLAMQLVNVKVVLLGVTVFSVFVLPYTRAPLVLAGVVAVMAGLAFGATTAWAAFGAVFQKLLYRYKKAVDVSMALLLVFCALSVLLR